MGYLNNKKSRLFLSQNEEVNLWLISSWKDSQSLTLKSETLSHRKFSKKRKPSKRSLNSGLRSTWPSSKIESILRKMKSLGCLRDGIISGEIPQDTSLLKAVKIQAEPQQAEIMEFLKIRVPKRAPLYSHWKEFKNTRFAPVLHTPIEWVGLNSVGVISAATKSWLLKGLKVIRAQTSNKEDWTIWVKIV